MRGQSVTFATLFACGVLGFSVLGGFRHLLSRFGAPWYVWLIVPIVVVGIVARKEAEWLPDLEQRRKWSRWLVFGSLLLSFLIAHFRHPSPKSGPIEPAPAAIWHR